MWWLFWLLVIFDVTNQQYQYDDTEQFSDAYDFDDETEVPSSTVKYLFTDNALTRVRRYGLVEHVSPSGYDVGEVKDALRQILSGRRLDDSQSFLTHSWRTNIEDEVVPIVATRSKPQFEHAYTILPGLEHSGKMITRTHKPTNTPMTRYGWYRLPQPGERSGRRQGNETTTTPSPETTTSEPTTTTASRTTTTSQSPKTTASESPTTTTKKTGSPKTTTSSGPPSTTKKSSSNATTSESPTTTKKSGSPKTTTAASSSNETTTGDAASTTSSESPESTTTISTTTTKRTTKSTTPRFDIEALLDIVANLTYDYDTNLTQVLNETLLKFSIPTCRTPTTTVTTTTVTTTEVFYNTTVISKCFVCGLDIPGIPRNTFCSDAFATDFLPLVPIDATAKGHIARFRKYCRYFDVNNYQLNRTDSRAMLGRWTGGCAVRWIDLSGVYTQRTCRNRLRPTTGLHFASKRMAKLELALSNVDNGCIISPMATLVPLSRGISLYARFHACVCTGNWCNRAKPIHVRPVTCYSLLVFIYCFHVCCIDF